MGDLLRVTDAGPYCAAGDFYIDPWRPVPRAVVTHAHGDHAVRGCEHYLTSTVGRGVLASRMAADAVIQGVDYGAMQSIGGVKVALHPAGHILGSCQVRVENRGEVWVVSGDYKLSADATCTPFEPVRCDTFITECTFGLPIYRWPPQARVFGEVNSLRSLPGISDQIARHLHPKVSLRTHSDRLKLPCFGSESACWFCRR